MANTGKNYEKLTQAVFEWIINEEQISHKTINVQHDYSLEGNVNKHQIDVYWEFEVAGITYKTLIQAKELSRKVEQSQMETFHSVLSDVPGATGVFVTNIGYQPGAEKRAEASNIHTYILRNPQDSDWDGYIKTLVFEMHMRTPHADNLHLIIDGNWARENCMSELPASNYYQPHNMRVVDKDGVEKSMYEVMNSICEEVGISEQTCEREHKFDEHTFIIFPDGGKLKVLGVRGHFCMHEAKNSLVIDGGKLVSHILKDVVKGESRMFRTRTLPYYKVRGYI